MADGQSPVAIPSDAPIHESGLTIAYRATPLIFGDQATVLQVDSAPGSTIRADGAVYDLSQFHFHCPSEHTIGARHAAGELHLVHASGEGAIGVLAVMLEEGDHLPALDVILAVPGREAEPIDPSRLLPADRRYVTYVGSLTMPPYTQGVAWFVLTTPVTVSTEQLTALKAIHDDNNRSLQPLAGRTFN